MTGNSNGSKSTEERGSSGPAAGLTCTVYFLDESIHEFVVSKGATGSDLLDTVFDWVGLRSERGLFGLQFISLLTSTTARMRWLDAKKSLRRQIVCAPYQLFFRVKFYVPTPEWLAEPLARHLLYVQLRRDFLDGKFCSPYTGGDELIVLLASFVAQCELGDAPAADAGPGVPKAESYLGSFRFAPTHPPDFEVRVERFHRAQRGLSLTDAQFNFCLYTAKRIALYGLDLYNAKDGNGQPILLGVNHEGIAVLDDAAIVNRFSWTAVLKLSFKRQIFFLRIRRPVTAGAGDAVETTTWEELELSFNAICARNCKMLWRSCAEHHAFFRGTENDNNNTNNKSMAEDYSCRWLKTHGSSGYGSHRLAAMFQRHLRAFRGRKLTKKPAPITINTKQIPEIETNKSVNCGSQSNPQWSSAHDESIEQNYGIANCWLTADQLEEVDETMEEDYGSASTAFESTASLTIIHQIQPDQTAAAEQFTRSLYEPSPSFANGTTTQTEAAEPNQKRHSMTAALPLARPPLPLPPVVATATTCRPLARRPPAPLESRGSSMERGCRPAGPNFIFVVPVSALQPAAAASSNGNAANMHRFSTSSSSPASSGSASGGLSISGRRASPIRVINTPPPAHCAGRAMPIALQPAAAGQPPLVGYLIPESRLSGCVATAASASDSTSLPRCPRKLSQPDGGGRIRTAQKFIAPPSPAPSFRLPSPGQCRINRILDPYAATSATTTSLSTTTRITTNTVAVQPVTIAKTNGVRLSTAKFNGIVNNNNNSLNKNYKISNSTVNGRMSVTVVNGSTASIAIPNPISNGTIANDFSTITVADQKLSTPTVNSCTALSIYATVVNKKGSNILAENHVTVANEQVGDGKIDTTVLGDVIANSKNNATVNNDHSTNCRNDTTVIMNSAKSDKSESNVVNIKNTATVVPPARSLTQCLDEIIANGRTCAAVDDAPFGRERSPRASSATPSSTVTVSSEMPPVVVCLNGTVVVRVTANALRRANLRITGGADCAHPALVSGIAAAPAGGAAALSVGDQLLRVNGLDVTRWTQADVTAYVRQLADQLVDVVFTVRPNVYRLVADDTPTSADSCVSKRSSAATAVLLDDSTLRVADTVPRSDALAESIAILRRALDGGAASALFEQVYRRRPGASMDDAHRPVNAAKNRYRDVCPYDATRVRLCAAPSGDYINANHVNMHIPSSGVLNRYIATQGPLPGTFADFWWMIWENNSTTVVMLTTLAEKGRVKCHCYWPEPDGPPIDCPGVGQNDSLELSAVGERLAPHCHYREIAVRHKTSDERRLVTQMQYTAWPDHGVPDNSEHFMRFVDEVRAVRRGFIGPIVVHCSAGIGRTGVLIMMETAVCMIEANEPVYPLDIMRTMRDQRAMLIQTVEQFEFVCRSILRAFDERSVEPLAEYQCDRTAAAAATVVHSP